MKARRRPWEKTSQTLRRAALLRLEAGVPAETRKALADLGWPMGESDGGFGRYECIENRKQGEDAFTRQASEMRADAVALAY